MTLLERVRSVLVGVRLNKEFWAKAFNTISYLINRSPSTIIDFITPIKMWTSQVPYFNNLKSFSCTTYPYIKQDKIGERALKCVFQGYHGDVKGYKL